jgi:hypothetical protein
MKNDYGHKKHENIRETRNNTNIIILTLNNTKMTTKKHENENKSDTKQHKIFFVYFSVFGFSCIFV